MLSSILEPYHLPTEFTSHRICGLTAMLRPGETAMLADISGPGCIRHFMQTMQPNSLRSMVLRAWWDDEELPSIECPVSDFYGIGHDLATASLSNAFFYVAPRYGYNCYLPMPFARRARITLTNDGTEPVTGIHQMIGFTRFTVPLEVPYRLHVAWRRVFPAYRRGAGVNLVEAKGAGRMIGVMYHVAKRDSDDRWSHGGGDQFFIDGETASPNYIYGIGGEDFAHHAWGLAPGAGPYSGAQHVHPLPGIKRAEGPVPFQPHGWEQHDGGQYSMYRFFVPDVIRFKHSLRLTFGTAANEISATSYWYQDEPHTPFCSLPATEKRKLAIRLTEEETYQPLDLGQSIPVAVLGPILRGASQPMTLGAKEPTKPKRVPWSPKSPLKLDYVYKGNIDHPYGDVVKPPYQIRWRRSEIRGGFIDLTAIHRPKCHLRARGLWNYRHIPLGSWSYQLIRLRLNKPRQLILRVGYEDRLELWHGKRLVTALYRPEPDFWQTSDIPLDLKAGTHDLILANSQERWARWSAWCLGVKFLDPDGRLAEGLRFERFPTLDPTPERFRETWPIEEPIPCDSYRDPALNV